MGFGPSWPNEPRRRSRTVGLSAFTHNRKLRRSLALLVLGLIAGAASRYMPAVVEGQLEGRPRFVDGDSFFIGEIEVRMQGIDAPEGRQTCTRDDREWRCGDDAKRTLQRLAGSQPVHCDIHSTDQHGRRLATCFSATGTNLNARMVAEGFAVSFSAYQREEAEAKAARRGIWGSKFERPQDWRRTNNVRS